MQLLYILIYFCVDFILSTCILQIVPAEEKNNHRELILDQKTQITASLLLKDVFSFCRFFMSFNKVDEDILVRVPWHLSFLSPVITTISISNHQQSFLLEPRLEGEFQRFTNNYNFIPDGVSDLHKFLSFSQHVNYIRSNGKLVVTDHQGTEEYLSDPQLATST